MVLLFLTTAVLLYVRFLQLWNQSINIPVVDGVTGGV